MSGRIAIGLLGTHLNSSNLGCQALSYSLLNLLEQLSREYESSFSYYIFEYSPSEKKATEVAEKLGIQQGAINCFPISPIYRLKSFARHFRENIDMIRRIRSCAFVIDMTAGDSFSDIYGESRFQSNTRIKRIVELLGIRLVLGPQTYGPFLNESNIPLAKAVFQHCSAMIARDRISAELASHLSGKEVPFTTDLAFQLPYEKRIIQDEGIHVAVNISGLLVREHVEAGIEKTIKLNTDYDEYIEAVLDYLCGNEKYKVTLLAHVNEDMRACIKYHERFPRTKIAPLFDNPIDIKSYISGFDVFIGARMHATIAAFSSGVATIPTAYSRKFSGLFDVVKYARVVDLQDLSTQEAVDRTIDYIANYQIVGLEVRASMKIAESYESITRNFFISAISDRAIRS